MNKKTVIALDKTQKNTCTSSKATPIQLELVFTCKNFRFDKNYLNKNNAMD